MTGSARSSDGLDPRRRRALFRAWHRGTREMDLLLGRFADAYIEALSEADLAHLEALMEVPDRDLFAWVTGRDPVAANYETPLYRALVAFHATRHEQD
ncbi:MAG: succinate dehydrogenase assembly factor 2 [Rhizobiales bacterium]|nr:succinate dehydrogenase assembly factor 2 [Hyphomicrobiales bacterium]MDQ3559444.1 succinate dehydrogenase assembly factor 2 [Pseudomonadota bacterium]